MPAPGKPGGAPPPAPLAATLPAKPLDIWLGGSAPAGLSLPVALAGNGPGNEQRIPDALLASIRRRRPDTDPAALVAAGWDGARRMIGQYVEAGLSKFVVRPAAGPASFGPFADGFVRELMPLQN